MKAPLAVAALISCILLPGCNRTDSPDAGTNESPASSTQPAPSATPAPDTSPGPGTTPGTTTPGTAPDGTTTTDDARDTTRPVTP